MEEFHRHLLAKNNFSFAHKRNYALAFVFNNEAKISLICTPTCHVCVCLCVSISMIVIPIANDWISHNACFKVIFTVLLQ